MRLKNNLVFGPPDGIPIDGPSYIVTISVIKGITAMVNIPALFNMHCTVRYIVSISVELSSKALSVVKTISDCVS